ncbi:cobalamin/Fe3+-siderophore ABC transporter ATP-binding protein [Sporomusaceae bacterium FL31]|nr:cobalamin/Fe3+-siderophore ABC transporter ATP-binding protein [Sporomusaceae bacterium FL31]GCE34028.1 cobalamin/Fe3+-siderophore ABC transporter ATP-binding protein [Sporomusaceae bacterium]
MSNRALIAVENLSVRLGHKVILKDINLTVRPGEFIGIIGPNGAGKTTLLRSLRGLCPVISGSVTITGQPVSSMTDKQLARIMAYMQQDVNISFGFTALEVVLAGRYPYLEWWQNESNEDYELARKYMQFTGVEKLAGKSVQRVSGGERQRILLAKVLTQETPLILLDEPTASLDLVYQEEIFRHCQTICKQGKAALLVAHDIKLAAKFCTRLILIADTRIVADGEPAQVITVENLRKSYGLHSAVFINQVTGHLDIHTYDCSAEITEQQRVHVIGGGASAGPIIRDLYEKAYTLSGGVFHCGDADIEIAQAFSVDYLAEPALCAIGESLGQQNRIKIEAADWTILCNLCYSNQNLDNLQAAFTARKLIVIEDTPIEERDFTGGEAAALYQKLVSMPQVDRMSTAELIAATGSTIKGA